MRKSSSENASMQNLKKIQYYALYSTIQILHLNKYYSKAPKRRV
jgi:hypothetical protein